jgi:hypothetical protein
MVKVNFDKSQVTLYKISAKVGGMVWQAYGMVFVQPVNKPP